MLLRCAPAQQAAAKRPSPGTHLEGAPHGGCLHRQARHVICNARPLALGRLAGALRPGCGMGGG